MKKTLLSILTGASLLASSLLAQTPFQSKIIDSGEVNGNCVVTIDKKNQKGLEHLVWSSGGTNVFHTTSNSDAINRLFPNTTNACLSSRQPSVSLNNGEVSVAFAGRWIYQRDWAWWTDSNQEVGTNGIWYVRQLPLMENVTNGLSVIQDGNFKRFLISGNLGTNQDINLTYSFLTNINPMAFMEFKRAGIQTNPQMIIDGTNGLHAIWQDTDLTGSTKVFYSKVNRNTGIQSGVPVSIEDSFDGSISSDTNGHVYVIYKTGNAKGEDINGNIYLAQVPAFSNRTLIAQSVNSKLGRNPQMSLDNNGLAHIVYTSLSEGKLNLHYVKGNGVGIKSLENDIIDTSDRTDLGWVSIDMYNGEPTILGNMHSLVLYKHQDTTPRITGFQNVGGTNIIDFIAPIGSYVELGRDTDASWCNLPFHIVFGTTTQAENRVVLPPYNQEFFNLNVYTNGHD